ncbi:MAG: chemotaxis protein CheB [Betaproteobacteria bacterium]
MVVGIGASAGGLKALTQLFEHLRNDTGMAYVVVVHMSPEHESRMPELLQQVTAMPVEAVTASVAIRPDHVYVISPKSELRVHDGKLEPSQPARRRSGAMTIDPFLETLAEAHQQRAVGIILSGSGSDGTLGLRAIKAHGGITIAQDPAEAEYDSMPRNAIASGAADFVLPAREMSDKIVRLWHNAQKIELPVLPDAPSVEDAAAEAEEALRDILATVRARTGHDFSQYKRATLMRRIERRLQVNQLQRLSDYRTYISGHAPEASALLHDLLINVTSFFRDPAAWQSLQQHVIPALFAGRKREQNVRVWVVGCATGEEVYSLAMLLQEHMQTLADPPTVNIFATDIDEDALAFARSGVYAESIAEHVSPERMRRFFTPEQGGYRVSKVLREMTMFAVHNIIQDPPFSRLDLVCCRNLLIYLTRTVQAKVLDLIHFSLRPEGFLFLGMAESIEDGQDGYAPFDKANRIFVQQPRASAGVTFSTLPMVQPQRYISDLAAAGGRRLVSFGELHQRLLEHYAPPSVIVDDRYDIVHLSDRAGHFLQLGPGEPSLNLLKVAPETLRFDIKKALDGAMASMRTFELTGLWFMRRTQRVRIDLKVHPVRDKASGRAFALVIFDEGAPDTPTEVMPANEPSAESSETARLEERLREMDSQLRAAVEQYEVQNEELKASNEELQATNEELRATTEELETGKEELQSINEELVTVNQELKSKVDETARVSEDLTNFVTATQVATMFVDRELRLVRYTPFTREIFNVIPGDVGRPLAQITHRLEDVDFEKAIRSVFDTLQLVESEAKSSDGRWYIVRALPYRAADDRIRGAVLTFIDITQRKKAEASGERSEAWAKLIVDRLRDYAIIMVDADGVIRSWNPGARNIFGYEEAEIVGKDIAVLFTPEDRAAGVPEDEMRRARETGRAEDDRWQLKSDGTHFFASGVLAAIDDPTIFGYVKVLRDLTEQKRADERQEELLAKERISRAAAEEANRLKDEFLAMLSHELRNPLALMLMQAEILLRAPEAKKSPRLRQAAQVIHEMVGAQAQLVEDMLDVSRARTGKLNVARQLLPLTFVVADSIGALRRQAEEKSVTLDMSISEAPLIVAADPVRVRQIAWNLLSNALKFTPAGGTIRVRLAREGNDARLDVEDTGRGIAPEVMPRIFDWFRQSEGGPPGGHGGMGIGLALVRQLVELHDGRVEAFSAGEGKGARFTVWLPLEMMTESARRRQSPTAGPGQRLAGLRILVVDDSAANGEALRELLQFEGANVVMQAVPAEAIRHAEKQRFDVVISDIAMPELDGYAVLKAIRATKTNAQTPAIAYSGYSGRDEVERARSAGFDMYLTKPVDVDRLLDAVRTVAKPESAAD